jgi:hypothetical protein
MINEYRVKKKALCNTPRIIFFPQKKKEQEKEKEKEKTPTESRTGNGSKKKTRQKQNSHSKTIFNGFREKKREVSGWV